MPAESTKGRFAISPMHTVPITEAIQVARSTAVGSMPVLSRMLGFMARIYAMVMKVVTPAIISVLTSV